MCLSEKIYSMTSLSINELQKSFKKEPKNSQIYLDVIDKLSTFAPAFETKATKFFEILINNTSSTRKNRTVNACWIHSSMYLMTGINEVNKLYGILNRANTILS